MFGDIFVRGSNVRFQHFNDACSFEQSEVSIDGSAVDMVARFPTANRDQAEPGELGPCALRKSIAPPNLTQLSGGQSAERGVSILVAGHRGPSLPPRNPAFCLEIRNLSTASRTPVAGLANSNDQKRFRRRQGERRFELSFLGRVLPAHFKEAVNGRRQDQKRPAGP